LYNLVHLLALQ